MIRLRSHRMSTLSRVGHTLACFGLSCLAHKKKIKAAAASALFIFAHFRLVYLYLHNTLCTLQPTYNRASDITFKYSIYVEFSTALLLPLPLRCRRLS